jgi:hypothetical protein
MLCYLRSGLVANIRATDWLLKIYFFPGDLPGNFENQVQILFQKLCAVYDKKRLRDTRFAFYWQFADKF